MTFNYSDLDMIATRSVIKGVNMPLIPERKTPRTHKSSSRYQEMSPVTPGHPSTVNRM